MLDERFSSIDGISAVVRDRLAAGLASAGFEVLESAATYFVNADVSPLCDDDATAGCERLPFEAGVVGIPTAAFTATP